MKIEIKHCFTGEVLFSHECENNTMKITLKAALSVRANLYGADLIRANLYGANLSEADLYGANLSGADLTRADLYGADLIRADLYGANLSGADLSGANLYGANLFGAYLSGANLSGANLSGANLTRAYLSGANLSGANLYGANLTGAKSIYDSHEILAQIAINFDFSLKPVAAMIAGRIVGCWEDYTATIRDVFGEETIKKLAEAWLQDEAWGVRKRLLEHGWIEEKDK